MQLPGPLVASLGYVQMNSPEARSSLSARSTSIANSFAMSNCNLRLGR
jgi:hypothetical protein